jgi:hypothetical protein
LSNLKTGDQDFSIAQFPNYPITQLLNFRTAAILETSTDRGVYIFGLLLGFTAGVLDVKFGDLLLTALFVLAATMLLGAVRPQRPWRWTLLVGAMVPIVQCAAYFLLTEKPYRAQIYESFLGFLTGIAGAYGGSAARKGMAELWK